MQLIFKSIRILRFRSFLEETVLDFGSSGHGLYFLTGKNGTQSRLGSNGSGKSSIIDALIWCLYGKTLNGLKNPDIVPWTGKGQTLVEVTLSKGGKKHTVTRTVGPNLIQIDGVETGQSYVDELIGIPFEAIPSTIVPRKPLFFDLTAGKKLEFLSNTLRLERWDERSEHAKTLVAGLEKEIGDIGVNLIVVQNNLERDQALFTELKDKSEEWEKFRQDILNNGDKDKTKLMSMLDQLQLQHGDADLALERAELEIRQSKADDFYNKIRAASLTVSRLEHELKAHIKEQAALQAKLDNSNEHLCPTCGQALKDHGRKNLTDQVKKALGSVRADIAAVNAAIEKERGPQLELQEMWEREEKAVGEFRLGASNARDTMSRLDRQIADYQAQIRALERRVQEYSDQNNPFQEQLHKLRQRINLTKSQIEKETQNAKTKQEYCERVRFWIKGFKDIKLSTLEDTLQELEIVTNGMLEEFGLSGWRVIYDVEKETKTGKINKELNIMIHSPENKNPVKWEVWSGGEAQRLRIIGTAALSAVVMNQLGISTNLEIYDEITDKLSEEGVYDLVELLAARARETKKSIWFIDHTAVQSNSFVETVKVVKDSKGSRIQ